MGAVKIDIHSGEYQFKNISLSDVDCIKTLILLRSQLDKFWCLKHNFNIEEASEIPKFNAELDCLYLDLDTIIEKANFTKKQQDLLDEIMTYGIADLDDSQIEKEFGETSKDINNMLNRICNKIKEINDQLWFDSIYLNKKKVTWNYKKCAKCGEFKPATSDFYTPDKTRKDGFFPYCKNCNK